MLNRSYSRQEARILALLSGTSEAKPITSKELVKRFYGKDKPPLNGQKIIIAVAKSLRLKVDANGESFMICKSARKGPIPINFWQEKRK